MKVSVFSRREIENMLPVFDKIASDTNFISINDVLHFTNPPFLAESPIPPEYHKQTLILHFEDVTTIDDDDNPYLFNKKKALEIKDFVKKTMAQNRNLFVHCHAGVSRSGAIGVVLNGYANKFLQDNPDDFYWFLNSSFYPRLVPNMRVATLLMRELEMM